MIGLCYSHYPAVLSLTKYYIRSANFFSPDHDHVCNQLCNGNFFIMLRSLMNLGVQARRLLDRAASSQATERPHPDQL